MFAPLAVPDGDARAAELEELSRRAAVYATRARGDGTRRAYRSAWRQYETCCASLGRELLGSDPIAMYVVRCAGCRFCYELDLRHPRLAMVHRGGHPVERRPAPPGQPPQCPVCCG
jgi:hypothetical protein